MKYIHVYNVYGTLCLFSLYSNKICVHFGLNVFSLDSYLYFHQVLTTHTIFYQRYPKIIGDL